MHLHPIIETRGRVSRQWDRGSVRSRVSQQTPPSEWSLQTTHASPRDQSTPKTHRKLRQVTPTGRSPKTAQDRTETQIGNSVQV
eukprot:2225183-Rhodomonas_salina.2